MRNFRNNFRRSRYKGHSDRNNYKNENGSKIINDLQNGSNFIRKNTSRNNHNASKLAEKYSNLAIEALSNGDKILSENYYQHAEHFIRVLGERSLFLNNKKDSGEEVKNDLIDGSPKKDQTNNIESDEKSEDIVSKEN
tara:strand:- start:17 stop:430 length:414 start_codon:yes stop_codon:yes gene_type:complete